MQIYQNYIKCKNVNCYEKHSVASVNFFLSIASLYSLLQSNERAGSYRVGEGDPVYHDNDLNISYLVTDRHREIAKWIREALPNVVHLYDVWHVAKGRL